MHPDIKTPLAETRHTLGPQMHGGAPAPAGRFAALTMRDLLRRTGSGSPSIRIGRFAWWDARPTKSTLLFPYSNTW